MTITTGPLTAIDAVVELRTKELTHGLSQRPCGCWLMNGHHVNVQTRMTVECRNADGVIVHTVDVWARTESIAKKAAEVVLYRAGIATRYEMHVAGANTDLTECCTDSRTCRACDMRVEEQPC
jgi:hypothetical protein